MGNKDRMRWWELAIVIVLCTAITIAIILLGWLDLSTLPICGC